MPRIGASPLWARISAPWRRFTNVIEVILVYGRWAGVVRGWAAVGRRLSVLGCRLGLGRLSLVVGRSLFWLGGYCGLAAVVETRLAASETGSPPRLYRSVREGSGWRIVKT